MNSINSITIETVCDETGNTYYETVNFHSHASKEQIKAKKKAYNEANKEQIKEQKKAYRQVNKERIQEYNEAYREAHKKQLNI